jgi:hypothetical protein
MLDLFRIVSGIAAGTVDVVADLASWIGGLL